MFGLTETDPGGVGWKRKRERRKMLVGLVSWKKAHSYLSSDTFELSEIQTLTRAEPCNMYRFKTPATTCGESVVRCLWIWRNQECLTCTDFFLWCYHTQLDQEIDMG